MRTLRLLVACTVVLASSAPRFAHAQGDDEEVGVTPQAGAAASTPAATPSSLIDTVYLRNGGMIRGRIQEILPGSHVAITLVTGETRKVPWSEIGKVVVTSTPAAPTGGAVVATPAAAPTPIPMVGPLVKVHVTSKKPVALLRRPSGSSGWVHACMSPCDTDLPINDTYKVGGSGITSSSEFRLQEQAGHTAHVIVDPASTSGIIIGGVMGGAGALGAYVGLILTVVGVAAANADCNSTYYTDQIDGQARCQRDRHDGPKYRDAGLVTMGVSAAVGIAGAFILFRSIKTDVSQGAGGEENDAYVRTPVWRAPAPVAAQGPSLFLPLVDAKF